MPPLASGGSAIACKRGCTILREPMTMNRRGHQHRARLHPMAPPIGACAPWPSKSASSKHRSLVSPPTSSSQRPLLGEKVRYRRPLFDPPDTPFQFAVHAQPHPYRCSEGLGYAGHPRLRDHLARSSPSRRQEFLDPAPISPRTVRVHRRQLRHPKVRAWPQGDRDLHTHLCLVAQPGRAGSALTQTAIRRTSGNW